MKYKLRSTTKPNETKPTSKLVLLIYRLPDGHRINEFSYKSQPQKMEFFANNFLLSMDFGCIVNGLRAFRQDTFGKTASHNTQIRASRNGIYDINTHTDKNFMKI